MYINTFKYTPKDVSCQLCTEYVKKLGCTALRCPWLAERMRSSGLSNAVHIHNGLVLRQLLAEIQHFGFQLGLVFAQCNKLVCGNRNQQLGVVVTRQRSIKSATGCVESICRIRTKAQSGGADYGKGGREYRQGREKGR